MPYFRRRFRRRYRVRVVRPRRSLGYGSRRVRRRFFKCRLNGGTWNRCKRRAMWKLYKWEKAVDPAGRPVYYKVPRPGWLPETRQYTRTRWVRAPAGAMVGV